MEGVQLSLSETRRLALVAQGFDGRSAKPTRANVRKTVTRLGAVQIDSVNVLTRAHYVPAFARVGPYDTATLDDLTYRRRELFEYWGHAASVMPVAMHPLVRYRMHRDFTESYMRSRQGTYLARVYDEVAERGPITAAELSDPGSRSGKWWGWGKGKATLEHLYDAGMLSIAGRRTFHRLYDLTERVIPRATLDTPAPARDDAMKELVMLGARASGVGTAADLAGYFHTDGWRDRAGPRTRWQPADGAPRGRAKPVVKRLISELVDEGRLLPASVDTWNEPAYVLPGTRVPRAVNARALVTPFDSLVWDRARIERLFGMRYSIEIYVPAPKRVYGYYVLPFVLGDTLVARCDLKADRARSVLAVPGAFLQPGQDAAAAVAAALADELREMQAWLGLDRIEVGERGDLARPLRAACR